MSALPSTSRTILISLCLFITALLGGAGGGVLSWYLLNSTPPRLVSVDLSGLQQDFIARLAQAGLDEAQTENTAAKWADRTAAKLKATAQQNNLIILPRSAGIFGIPDITDQLLPFLEAETGRLPATKADGS